MKKLLLLGSLLFFSKCGSLTIENQLDDLINSFENYKDSQNEENPLGIYTESRFENYAKFCDSLRLELEALKTDLKSIYDIYAEFEVAKKIEAGDDTVLEDMKISDDEFSKISTKISEVRNKIING